MERLITKKVMAIEVSDVSVSFVITRLRLNFLFACPNLPSIALRNLSSSRACFFVSLLTFLGGLPNGEPLILMPLSLQNARLALVL